MSQLTPKRQRFVQEYLVDLNATQAAIRAGYSEPTGAAIGSENLTKPEIALAIREAKAQRSRRTEVTADRVLEELARIAFASISDAVEWHSDGATVKASSELSPEVLAAVSEVSETRHRDGSVAVKVKMHDKLAALNKVADHLRMFVNRVEHSGNVNIEASIYDKFTLEELEEMLAALRAAKAMEGKGRLE